MKRGAWVLFFTAIGFAVLWPACSKKTEDLPPSHPAETSKAQYYYDLGPATIDVSAYPKKEQENYRLFLAVCGACHTTARPLNAPYTTEAQWKRFVRRMHLKMEGRGIALNQLDEEGIVGFLAYDSQARKVEGRHEFEETQAELKRQFKDSR